MNGVVHFIDKILFPATYSFDQLMQRDSRLSSMKSLLSESAINLPTGFTLFLPINKGFDILKGEALEELRGNLLRVEVSF